MHHYTLAFTIDAGPRVLTTDLDYYAVDDHAGIREGVRLARHGAWTLGSRLLEVHVGTPHGVPFFNWAKDFSFSLDQAVGIYERAVPA